MRLPIGYALAYPDRIGTPFGAMDWSVPRELTFEPPDRDTFRCLTLAEQAGRSGGTAPAWLSAANEVAVEAFLDGRLRWIEIAAVVQGALDAWDGGAGTTLDEILDADAAGRRSARDVVDRRAQFEGARP